jgi:hypothetical protein
MSTNVILVIVGIVLFLLGLAKLGRSGGFNLSNFGINIGGEQKQAIRVGNVASSANKSSKPDWVGLAIAAIGLLTALVGLSKALLTG